MYLMDEHSGLEVVTRDECLVLLAGEHVGRLGVIHGGEPIIFPVNYALDGDHVVFRTDPGAKLSDGTRDPACFEIDRFDPDTRSGWSVLMRGSLQEVDDFAGLKALRATVAADVQPWAPGAKSHWLRLIPFQITGRRIRPKAAG